MENLLNEVPSSRTSHVWGFDNNEWAIYQNDSMNESYINNTVQTLI
ncbi:MAG: hypothetical protein HN973_05665 [Lentimicrobiaceae bacterium]|nr:hypothetical protein [Lentimicrobiaceae bacterium]